MEKNINIAEILKDKKNGLRLYSPIFGECAFCHVRKDTNDICVKKDNGVNELFDSKGLYYNTGEVMLFPSKSMRDWKKLSWKKGDVLISNDGGTEVIFDKWYDDTYTSFYCKHYLNSEDKNKIVYYEEFLCKTARYSLEDKNTVQTYIKTIEEKLGSILNRETLEIEKQIEFNDGDIVTMHKKNCDIVFIFNRLRTEGSFYYYAFHALQTNNTGVIDCHITLPYSWTFFCGKMNFATDSEKQKIFDALAKENKAWNAEKKQIVDLKPKVELKPFDKVIVRCSKADKWSIDFFSYKVSNGYICTGDAWFGYCLPYNEKTAHLLGTIDEWKGSDHD